ncbi:hypothetical protein EHS25_003999 [Saitozyma podzolica]|uniref:Major facilitator superfamily (MFS) profile domain-containing protein n=1 Tax=Saitozyma podzolica TaxID=1890683 RepID=A0A427YT36_9TREE|nr:hypothetical protein EHS25_003999 [Saitozyma podzolica]
MSAGTDTKDLSEVTHLDNAVGAKGAADVNEVEMNHQTHHGMDREVAKYAAEHTVILTPEENNRLFKLINKRILTYMLVTYCWETLDKNTLSYAAVMGIKQDANLTAVQYGWLSTIVYLAELVFQYPVNRMFQSLPVARTISVAVICWGIVVALTPLCHDFAGLMAVRGLLGTFETAIQPGFTLLTSDVVRARRTGADDRPLVFHYQGVMKNWQLMFMILGILTVVWGFTALFWVPDSPTSAKCYSEEDKRLMVERMRSNQNLQNKEFKWYQAKEALTDPHLWAYAALNVLVTLPSGGVSSYNGLITEALGFTALQTDLLAMASGAFSLTATLIAIVFYRFTRWTLGSAAFCILPQLACVITMMSGVLVAYYLFQFIGPQVIIQISLVTQNVAGGTKKSIAIAMTWAGSMIGNCIGPQVFSTSSPPRYLKGFAVCLGMYSLSLVILAWLGLSYKVINHRRDKQRAALRDGDASERPEDLDNAFDDMTDRENPNFRYNY